MASALVTPLGLGWPLPLRLASQLPGGWPLQAGSLPQEFPRRMGRAPRMSVQSYDPKQPQPALSQLGWSCLWWAKRPCLATAPAEKNRTRPE